MNIKYILLLTIFIVTIAYSQDAPPPAEFNMGVQLFQSGDYDGAIELWQKTLEKDSTLAAAWFNMAIVHDMTEKDSIAIACYHRAAELRPEDPDPWVYLAQLHRNRQEPYLASKAYENAIVRKPGDAELLNSLAVLYDQLEEYTPAMEAVNRALEIDSLFMSAWANKVIIHNHLEQFDSAVYYGEIVTGLFPDEPITWAQLGLAYHYLEKDFNAIAAVDSAIAIYNELSMAHYYRAMILVELGKPSEAIASLKRAIELHEIYREAAVDEQAFEPLKRLPEFIELIGEEKLEDDDKSK